MAEADCLFCRIVAGEVPADIVASSDRAIAFRDIAPAAPVHVLVIPKRHAPNALAVAEHDPADAGELVRLAGEVARSEGLDGNYRLVFNTGPDAHQTVFHAHLHLLGGRPMGWPPG